MEENKLNKENEKNEINENKIPIEREENSESKKEETKSELEIKDAELKSAQEKINELEKQNAELKDTLLRKVAEFENYKRRNENDQMNLLKYAAESFIKNILPIYDDLERSLSHIDEENSTASPARSAEADARQASGFDSTKKGLLLVFEKFGKILENQGIKKIEAKGKPFDVHLHEALMQQPAEDVPPHTVLEVLEQGYMYLDRVIRHAKVIVSSEMASHEENSEKENNNESSQEG